MQKTREEQPHQPFFWDDPYATQGIIPRILKYDAKK